MNGWERNSRFWKITPWVVLLSAALSILFDDATAFIAVAGPWITVAGGKSIVSTYRGRSLSPLLAPPLAPRPVWSMTELPPNTTTNRPG